MSGRSSRFSLARAPLAPAPTVGRHARRLLRRLARQEAGDFSTLRAPLDVTYRRLVRRTLNNIRTRNAKKQ